MLRALLFEFELTKDYRPDPAKLGPNGQSNPKTRSLRSIQLTEHSSRLRLSMYSWSPSVDHLLPHTMTACYWHPTAGRLLLACYRWILRLAADYWALARQLK